MAALTVRMGRRRWLAAAGAGVVLMRGADARAEDFAAWRESFTEKAVRNGISERTVDRGLQGIVPSDRVIELDHKQSRGKASFQAYRDRAISSDRIRQGADRLRRHEVLLGRVRERFGVAPNVVMALWGMETSYGSFTGGFPIIKSLATLAWEGRRRELFERELIAALKIVQRGDVAPEAMMGSWAGAMGQCQFMPSTYLAHAVDFDRDGRADVWTTLPDVFASIANYLTAAGWDGGYRWGREVVVPPGLDATLIGLDHKAPLDRWRARGLRRPDGQPVAAEPLVASLVRTDDGAGPSFLVYDNFRTLMVWNRSVNFALSVGILSDAIAAEASA